MLDYTVKVKIFIRTLEITDELVQMILLESPLVKKGLTDGSQSTPLNHGVSVSDSVHSLSC